LLVLLAPLGAAACWLQPRRRCFHCCGVLAPRSRPGLYARSRPCRWALRCRRAFSLRTWTPWTRTRTIPPFARWTAAADSATAIERGSKQ